jgi:hypothetical protein
MCVTGEETLNGRCNPDATGDDMSCPDDLVCEEGPGYSSDTPVCHTPCAESAECTPGEVFDCIDGLCRIAQPLTKAASK